MRPLRALGGGNPQGGVRPLPQSHSQPSDYHWQCSHCHDEFVGGPKEVRGWQSYAAGVRAATSHSR